MFLRLKRNEILSLKDHGHADHCLEYLRQVSSSTRLDVIATETSTKKLADTIASGGYVPWRPNFGEAAHE